VSNKPNLTTFILMLHYKRLTLYLTWHLLSKSILTEYSTFVIYWRKTGSAKWQYIIYLQASQTPTIQLAEKSYTFSLSFVHQLNQFESLISI